MRAPGRDTAGQESTRGKKGHGGQSPPSSSGVASLSPSSSREPQGPGVCPRLAAVWLDVGSPRIKSFYRGSHPCKPRQWHCLLRHFQNQAEASWGLTWEHSVGTQFPFSKRRCGTSLVVPWLRICLPMQGTQVQSLAGELRFPRAPGQLPAWRDS